MSYAAGREGPPFQFRSSTPAFDRIERILSKRKRPSSLESTRRDLRIPLPRRSDENPIENQESTPADVLEGSAGVRVRLPRRQHGAEGHFERRPGGVVAASITLSG